MVSGRGLVALALLALSGFAGGACKGTKSGPKAADDAAAPVAAAPEWRPAAVIIGEILVRVIDPELGCELDQERLARTLGEDLGAQPGFYPRAAMVPADTLARAAAIRLGITYDVISEGKERSIIAAVEIDMEWRGHSDLTPLARVVVERILPRSRVEVCKVAVEHVFTALTTAVAEFVAKDQLRTGAPAEVVAVLAHDQADMVQWGLVLVRERKLALAFNEVIALIDSPVRDIRETALGALIAIGDERAVAVLAKKTELSDYESLRLVIEAVSAIGGDEAVSFLEFVATGHPDDDIRKRAESGLARIDKKRRPGAGARRE